MLALVSLVLALSCGGHRSPQPPVARDNARVRSPGDVLFWTTDPVPLSVPPSVGVVDSGDREAFAIDFDVQVNPMGTVDEVRVPGFVSEWSQLENVIGRDAAQWVYYPALANGRAVAGTVHHRWVLGETVKLIRRRAADDREVLYQMDSPPFEAGPELLHRIYNKMPIFDTP